MLALLSGLQRAFLGCGNPVSMARAGVWSGCVCLGMRNSAEPYWRPRAQVGCDASCMPWHAWAGQTPRKTAVSGGIRQVVHARAYEPGCIVLYGGAPGGINRVPYVRACTTRCCMAGGCVALA